MPTVVQGPSQVNGFMFLLLAPHFECNYFKRRQQSRKQHSNAERDRGSDCRGVLYAVLYGLSPMIF